MSTNPPPYAPGQDETKGLYPTVPADDQMKQPLPPQSVAYYPAPQDPGPQGYPATTYYPAPGAQPGQPQQLVVSPGAVVITQPQRGQSFVGYIVLSVFVTFCCACPCGLTAFILSVIAQCNSTSSADSARKIGKASLIISIIGIVVGVICIFIYVLAYLFAEKAHHNCAYIVDSDCYSERHLSTNSFMCDGHYSSGYCYTD